MLQSVKRKLSGANEKGAAGAPSAAGAKATGASVPKKREDGAGAGANNRPNTGSNYQNVSVPNKRTSVLKKFGGQGSSGDLEQLPQFKDVPAAERQSLFIKKLKLSTVVYDFGDPNLDLREKEVKRQTLAELVDYVNTTKNVFTEAVFPDILDMVSANILRPLPLNGRERNKVGEFEIEEEEPTLEPAWPHLQLVYEFFLRFIVSNDTDPKVAKRHFDQSFLVRLLELFDSEDPRERDYLKTITHRIYGKFMPHRAFVRRAINNIFFKFIYETEKHNGTAELLEILGSIINGFALPLKEEHKIFLCRALIPLHKVKCMGNYHQQLSYCITQFVEKDPKLAEPVIRGLCKYWPVVNSPKEVLLLNELEEVLEMTQPAEFKKILHVLFRQLAKSISSPHFQIAERALFIVNNDYIFALIAQNREVVFPYLTAALLHNQENHWNTTVSQLTFNILKLFGDMDQQLFDECVAKYKADKEKEEQNKLDREKAWTKIESMATQHKR